MVESRKHVCGLILTVILSGLLAACGQDQGTGGGERAGAPPPAEDKGPTLAEKRDWSGAKVYDEVCDKCHKMGVDDAPVLGDTQAWAPRIEKDEEVLYRHVLEGFNKMPPRGDCGFCTDAQLREAMQYMLGESRQPRATSPE